MLRIGSQRTDLQQDVNIAQVLPLGNSSTRIGIAFVRIASRIPSPLLNPDLETRLFQLDDVPRNQRNASFTWERLLQNTCFHDPANELERRKN